MKVIRALLSVSSLFFLCGCGDNINKVPQARQPIVGTWRLITGIIINNGDTVQTDYTKTRSFIKIINDTHFAFLKHDLKNGKDAVTAAYDSGGGTYTLTDSIYTEHLEYCMERVWEGNDFKFTVTIKQDTLVQTGVEKIEKIGVNRLNIEKYVRLNK